MHEAYDVAKFISHNLGCAEAAEGLRGNKEGACVCGCVCAWVREYRQSHAHGRCWVSRLLFILRESPIFYSSFLPSHPSPFVLSSF